MATQDLPNLYERLGGVYSIANGCDITMPFGGALYLCRT